MSHVTQGASWPWGSRPCHSEMPQGRPAPTGRLKPQLPTSPGPPPWSLAQDCLRRQRAERTAWAQDACRGNGSKGGTLTSRLIRWRPDSTARDQNDEGTKSGLGS